MNTRSFDYNKLTFIQERALKDEAGKTEAREKKY